MRMADIPFGTTDWAAVEPTVAQGRDRRGHLAHAAVRRIRVRMVEYSPGYVADHWCEKGHILFCVEGELRHGPRGRPVASR